MLRRRFYGNVYSLDDNDIVFLETFKEKSRDLTRKSENNKYVTVLQLCYFPVPIMQFVRHLLHNIK